MKRSEMRKQKEPKNETPKDESPVCEPGGGLDTDELEHGARPDSVYLPRYERIVETIFAIDPDAVFARVMDRMKFSRSVNEMTRAELREELADADELANQAAQLYADARAALELADFDNRVLGAELRSEAERVLTSERSALADAVSKSAPKPKQITEGDIEAYIASRFTNEARRMAERNIKNRKAVEMLASVAERWAKRHRTLEALLNTAPH